jgi:rhamnose transport system ATP-binding protein
VQCFAGLENPGARFGDNPVARREMVGSEYHVYFDKSLGADARILIMDEPTRGIDVGAKSEIHRLMSELAVQQGLAVLMISSELPEVLGMSDRVLVMREGSLVAEFTREEATQERVVTAMMSETAQV